MRRRLIVGPSAASGIEFVGAYVTQVRQTEAQLVNYDGNLTGGTSSTVSEGDMVIVFAAIDDDVVTTGVTASAGWTRFVQITASDANDITLAVFYKIMTATPDTSVTITANDAFDNLTTGCIVLSGVDAGSPFDATTTTHSANNGAQPNPPSITKVDENALVVAIGAASGSDSGGRNLSDLGTTDLDGFHEHSDDFLAVGVGYSFSVTDPAQFTGGSTHVANSNASATISLAPE